MHNALKPYGEIALTMLVAKIGKVKTPELEVGGKRVLGVERPRTPLA